MEEKIDFSTSNSFDPTEVNIYEVTGAPPTPASFLLKKTAKAIQSTINSKEFTFTTPQRFQTIELKGDNIIGILDIKDSEGNTWYEVPHLAQETIYDGIKNTNPNDPNSVLSISYKTLERGARIEWPAKVGAIYQLQTKDNLQNNWKDTGPAIFAGDKVVGITIELNENKSFFRVVKKY